MSNAWQEHLSRFRSTHPGVPLKHCMQGASLTYRGKGKASKTRNAKKNIHSAKAPSTKREGVKMTKKDKMILKWTKIHLCKALVKMTPDEEGLDQAQKAHLAQCRAILSPAPRRNKK